MNLFMKQSNLLEKFLPIIILSTILIFLNNCKDSTSEPEHLFEYNKRVSNSITILENVDVIKISNQIGFIIVNGTTNISESSYLLDKTVKVKDISLSEEAFNKIYLDYKQIEDTLEINIISPENDSKLFVSNLSISIPFNKKLYITKLNEGSYISYLDADVKIETGDFESTIFNVYGSINISSEKGNVTATTSLPENGNCKITSESGNIVVKIPTSTNANVTLKTDAGNLAYNNLIMTVSSSTAKEIKGTINNNEGEIYLFSKNGNIVLEGF